MVRFQSGGVLQDVHGGSRPAAGSDDDIGGNGWFLRCEVDDHQVLPHPSAREQDHAGTLLMVRARRQFELLSDPLQVVEDCVEIHEARYVQSSRIEHRPDILPDQPELFRTLTAGHHPTDGARQLADLPARGDVIAGGRFDRGHLEGGRPEEQREQGAA